MQTMFYRVIEVRALIDNLILRKCQCNFMNLSTKTSKCVISCSHDFSKALSPKRNCSAHEQSQGKDRKNFISCSFNIVHLFFKYVKTIMRAEKFKLYDSLPKRTTEFGLFCVDENTGNRCVVRSADMLVLDAKFLLLLYYLIYCP